MSIKTIKYYRLDNTGFTNGTSWFEDVQRYDTFEQVKELYKRRKWRDDVKWRIVEITITKFYNDPCNTELLTEEITHERYLYVSQNQET